MKHIANRARSIRPKRQHRLFPALLMLAVPFTANAAGSTLTAKEKLGQQLFFDTNLSTPTGQSCATCHTPEMGFTDPNKDLPTSRGILPKRVGNRNTPTALYAAFSPVFHYDSIKSHYIGGQFWDGRAATLTDQAKGPFLNPLEMANPNQAAVVNKVKQSRYAGLFTQVYGVGALDNVAGAYNNIADAIAAFEGTSIFRPFTSKYDYFLAGKATLTTQEERGRLLFEDPNKGNCAVCHVSRPAVNGAPPLFTDFSYDNLGVPKNPNNPFYQLQVQLNPVGWNFVDKGLGGVLNEPTQDGKFKVPTLRNIAITDPYMHNGYFKTLRGVVNFYSSRDIKSACATEWTTEANAIMQNCWPAPEMNQNVNIADMGRLNLNNEEINDIVAFMRTLTDGYKP